ncbi:MAG: hypothetical protein ACLFN9_21175, partial [Desulfococcaceae bacterium]
QPPAPVLDGAKSAATDPARMELDSVESEESAAQPRKSRMNRDAATTDGDESPDDGKFFQPSRQRLERLGPAADNPAVATSTLSGAFSLPDLEILALLRNPGIQVLQAAHHENDPKNPPGTDDDVVIMGAFADSFPVAAEGALYLAGLSYDVPVEWGPINKLTFYNDYSILVKEEDGFEDSQINTLGALISANPVFTYIDLIMGKNMQYLGGPDDSLAAGEDGDWETRFNINVGYYF